VIVPPGPPSTGRPSRSDATVLGFAISGDAIARDVCLQTSIG